MKILIPVSTLVLLMGCEKVPAKVEPFADNAIVANEIKAPAAKPEAKKPVKK